MKHYFFNIALALAFIGSVIALVVMKRGDNAQHESDAGAIADFSNRLDSAQTQIAICNGTITVLSNSLVESQSASLTFSNQWIEAGSVMALNAEQITNLSRQVAELTSENQTLGRRVTDLTNLMASQMAGLTNQFALTQATLDRANSDYALLENRLRRDVAERVVVERKFNNPAALKAQIENLQWSPSHVVSAESIYAGLDVEVISNMFHVISPN
jgi:chromosome segregation ATPase